ncbi:O-methyltransferase [Paenibacillus hexagrammi]|uniref:O-methyltransferase n=1 Tax=Paenibacillus hexagrammi TaxID=2908839 RepID=A0ABY3SP56_9BACL|nr:O-methyltransferase [Paenibacillus sp. YPD9-1]UJF34876.1 O-methyltransferase [Paenibacillus sp. YPD9-1]
MKEDLAALLEELYQFGIDHDAVHQEKNMRMRNITPATGEFLTFMVHQVQAKRVLEIGTSNGYSTLWLAAAAQETGGSVTTLEFDAAKANLAHMNFQKSGLDSVIELIVTDAGLYLQQHEEEFDLIFMDSDRTEYVSWWPMILRVLRQGGLIAVDNACSHAEEIQPFLELVQSSNDVKVIRIPMEQGILLITRAVQVS